MDSITYRKVSGFWFLLFVLLGFLQFWHSRYEISTDFLAYSDIADSYINGDWKYALNSSWPPLFSWLLTIPISLAYSPESETIFCHLLQYSLYISSLGCLWIIIPELCRFGKIDSPSMNEKIFVSMTWLVSGLLLLGFAPIYLLTPDILQVPFVFMNLYLILAISNHGITFFRACLLGLFVSFGFYAKSIFLPLAPFIFGVAVLFAKTSWLGRLKNFLVMSTVFAIAVSPFVIAISLQKGRFTFGDSGKINYGLFVSKTIDVMSDKNLTEENLLVTSDHYPYHYSFMVDRAVWEDPSDIQYRFADILKSLGVNTKKLLLNKQLLFLYLPLIVAVFLWSRNTLYRDLLLLMPALTALAIYLMIWVDIRYVMMWIIWITLVVLMRSFQPNINGMQALIKNTALTLLVAMSAVVLTKKVYNHNYHPEYMLSEFDIGGRIASTTAKDICVIDCRSVIDEEGPGRMYWVRHSPCRVRAKYAFGEKYHSLSFREKNAIFAKLKQENIDTVVFIDPSEIHRDWMHVGSDYYLYFLEKNT